MRVLTEKGSGHGSGMVLFVSRMSVGGIVCGNVRTE